MLENVAEGYEQQIKMYFPTCRYLWVGFILYTRVCVYIYVFVIEICFQVKERRKYFLIYNLSNCHKSPLLRYPHYFIFHFRNEWMPFVTRSVLICHASITGNVVYSAWNRSESLGRKKNKREREREREGKKGKRLGEK